jgi:hypothetical protein
MSAANGCHEGVFPPKESRDTAGAALKAWWRERKQAKEADRQRAIAICEAAHDPNACRNCGSRAHGMGLCDRCFDLMIAKEYR